MEGWKFNWKNGMVEYWNTGVALNWNNGKMEYRKNGP
jgi:hypothetical protein